MKKLLAIVFCVLFICMSFAGCGKTEKDEELVIYMAETEYFVDGVLREKNSYDDSGNLTEILAYDQKGEETSHKFWKYSDTDKILEEGKYKNGKVTYKKEHTYNKNDQLLETWEHKKDGSAIILQKNKYNEHNQLVEETSYNDGKERRRVVYKYDSDGNEAEWKSYLNGQYSGHGFYEYSSDGKYTKRSSYKNDELTQIAEWKKNELGYLISTKFNRYEGDKITCEEYNYDYDSNGQKIYYAHLENGVELERWEKAFDSSEKMLENRVYENGIITREELYKYYENGIKKNEIYITYKDGKENHRQVIEYNEKGNLEVSTSINANGHTARTEGVHEYNKEGLAVKGFRKINGELKLEYECEYDEKGNKVKSIHYSLNSNSNSNSNEVYYYKYDSEGNQIEVKKEKYGKTFVTRYKPLRITKEKRDFIDEQLNGKIMY